MAFCNSELSPIMWSQQIQCSLPYGKCINNECVCEKGYGHDLYIDRYRDCKVPDHFLVSIDSITIIFTTLSLLYCCINMKLSRNLARKIIQSATVMNVFLLLFVILKTYDNHIFTGKALFFFNTYLSFLFLCWNLIVYSLMLPICKILQLSVHKKKMVMIISFTTFRVITLIITLINIIMYDDPSDARKDNGWSNIIAIGQLLSAVEIVVLSAGTVYNGRMIIFEIMKIKIDSTSSKPYDEYLKRVQNLVDTHKVQLYSIFLGLTCPVIQFTTGYVPYSFALFSLVQLTCPYISYKFASFAVINKRVGELTERSNASKRIEVSPLKQVSTSSSHNQQPTS